MEHVPEGRPTAGPHIDPDRPPPDKATLRRRLRATRATRDAAERHREDDARTAHLIAWLARLDPLRRVACYESRDAEPDTAALIRWLRARGVVVVVPHAWQGPGNGAAPPRWAALGEDPPGDPAASGDALTAVDAILVPGLAGTRGGDRLGRGAGWYDRALLQRRGGAPTCLLLYRDEVLSSLPTEPHDVAVNYLATPDGVVAAGCHDHLPGVT